MPYVLIPYPTDEVENSNSKENIESLCGVSSNTHKIIIPQNTINIYLKLDCI